VQLRAAEAIRLIDEISFNIRRALAGPKRGTPEPDGTDHPEEPGPSSPS